MLCKHCQTENPADSIYCMGCGMPLEQYVPDEIITQPEDPVQSLRRKLKKWKLTSFALIALTAVLLVGTVWALVAYADLDDYANDKRAEAREWKQAYNELVEHYDLEGRYAIEITDIFNGTDEDAVLDRDMNVSKMDCLHFKVVLRALNSRWPDDVYADVYDPNGDRMFSDRDRAFTYDVKGISDSSSSWDSWFRDGSWERGSYWLVFYQGDTVIHVEEIVIH